jgi:hypothetical protein
LARPANGISLAMAHHEGFVLELAGPATATALAGTGVSYIRDGGTCLRLIAPCYGCYCTHTQQRQLLSIAFTEPRPIRMLKFEPIK